MRQVGNAVPPLLALPVGKAIYQCLVQIEGATAMETATLTPAIASGSARGASEFLSAVSTQVQLSKALRNVSPARLSVPSQTVENPQELLLSKSNSMSYAR
jgi:hypothetical protein